VVWRGLKTLIKQPSYALYERRLAKQIPSWDLPKHIGIIMDGNRRFARELGRSRVLFGHSRGAEKLREVLRWCRECEIPVVTVWSFSLDNFDRNDAEVRDLLQLFEDRTRELIDSPDVHDNGIRVRYIGKTDLLPDSLQQAIAEVEHSTRNYDGFHLNIAMAYGGRQEITDAFRQYLVDRDSQGATLGEVAAEVNDTSIERYLYTQGQPEPDLILRTSGEIRMSGFLLWQSAYSEYYFCDTYWPAFRRIDLYRALRAYGQRHRRLGR
jgi:short-chain Z-isoprenyl diphosphate synthase